MKKIALQEGLLKEWVEIAIVQIEVPFGECFREGKEASDDAPIYLWEKDKEHKEQYKQHTQKILLILDKLKEENAKITVFPEYSIPPELIPKLKNFSEKHNMIIIAGSHQVTKSNSDLFRKNVVPILIPGEETIFCSKKQASRYEQRIVRKGEGSIVFNWEYNGNTMGIQISLCSDYILKDTPLDENPGAVIVLIASNKLDDFNRKAQTHIRQQKFIFLCNAIGEHYCGKSAVFGANHKYNNPIKALKKEEEEVIIANYHLAEPYVVSKKPTQEDSAADPISNLRVYSIIQEGESIRLSRMEDDNNIITICKTALEDIIAIAENAAEASKVLGRAMEYYCNEGFDNPEKFQQAEKLLHSCQKHINQSRKKKVHFESYLEDQRVPKLFRESLKHLAEVMLDLNEQINKGIARLFKLKGISSPPCSKQNIFEFEKLVVESVILVHDLIKILPSVFGNSAQIKDISDKCVIIRNKEASSDQKWFEVLGDFYSAIKISNLNEDQQKQYIRYFLEVLRKFEEIADVSVQICIIVNIVSNLFFITPRIAKVV